MAWMVVGCVDGVDTVLRDPAGDPLAFGTEREAQQTATLAMELGRQLDSLCAECSFWPVEDKALPARRYVWGKR